MSDNDDLKVRVSVLETNHTNLDRVVQTHAEMLTAMQNMAKEQAGMNQQLVMIHQGNTERSRRDERVESDIHSIRNTVWLFSGGLAVIGVMIKFYPMLK